MANPRTATGWAKRDHEQNCRNEPPWPNLSAGHMWVHEVNGTRTFMALNAGRGPKRRDAGLRASGGTER